jgi:malonate decarboxylase alpha subunit
VNDEAKQGSPRCCTTRRDEKQRRLQLVSFLMNSLLLPGDKLVESLQLLIAPGDRIALEGDNQKSNAITAFISREHREPSQHS